MAKESEIINPDSGVDIVIIDIECTCDDAKNLPRSEMEIIEIGAVFGRLTDVSFVLVDEVRIYVRPVIHAKLTQFCISLTGITQDVVDTASPLSEGLKRFAGRISSNSPRVWGSWGNFDLRQFEKESLSKNITNPLVALPHVNIKQLYARKRGHRVGLARAIRLSGLVFQGRHHSGLDDARNIAQLLEVDGVLREAILQRV